MNTPLPLIIIGTGLAGYNLAKEFRKLNATRALILITEDAGHFYSKPQLSTALQQKKSPEQLIITTCEKMQEQLNATLYTHSKVTAIDPLSHTLTVETPSSTLKLHYSQLVLAMGAKPKALPSLDNLPNHFRVNNLQDYERFIQQGSQTQHCAIIGSGLVGCEFAHDFSHHIPLISVITPDPYPLYGLVPAAMGHSLQNALTEKGIQWFTNSAIDKAAELAADHILIAIGLNPDLTLAKQAKLVTNQGIVVNETLQTSDPHIYALGDCAEIAGTCRQYVAPILQSARALAQTLNGTRTSVQFPAFPISLKVSSYPIITMPPAKGVLGEWHVVSNNSDHKALFIDDNEMILGYALSGNYLEERQSILALLNSRRPACADAN